MTDLRIELADTITALIEPYEHAETYELRSPVPDGRPTQTIRVHRVKFPSLLDQLATAVEPSASAIDGARAGYSSKPSARIDAIDRLLAIEVGAANWLRQLDEKLRHTTYDNLRALVGLETPDDVLRLLVADARAWLIWARVVTGWEKPPRTLKEPCMNCGIRGRTRVRLDPNQATCLDCGSVWQQDDGTFGLLIEHVRYVNGEEETAA